MTQVDSFIGKQFYYLTVLEKIGVKKDSRNDSNSVYLCRCKCGNIIKVIRPYLRKGMIKSCGCLQNTENIAKQRRIFVGQKKDRLTVKDVQYINSRSHAFCICDCGNEVIINLQKFKRKKQLCCADCNKKSVNVGERFGYLIVVKRKEDVKRKPGNNSLYTEYICRCDCGKEVTVESGSLKSSGPNRSCGCIKSKLASERNTKYLPGMKVGKLTILSKIRKSYYRCICDCGKIISIYSTSWTTGYSMSCGCDRKERYENTVLSKYGVKNVSQAPDIKNKKEETCLKNYGVRHPSQNRNIALKQAKTVNNCFILTHWKTQEDLPCRGSYEKEVVNYLNFNQINFDWQIPFNLSDGRTYIIDFLDKDRQVYVEIKGWWRDDAYEKFLIFRSDYPELEVEIWDKTTLISKNIPISNKPIKYHGVEHG